MVDNGGFLTSSRENPRLKPMLSSNEVTPQKSLTPILDRFKALLKERDDDIRVFAASGGGGGGNGVLIPPPSTDEIVNFYELVLAELVVNSKPIITDLTIIAGEQRQHGEGIADAICVRIFEVSAEQKLPALYLLDSIVKNIGQDYVRHFSARLPEVFCLSYRQAPPNLHPSMRHLFGTWSAVFPSSVLRKIESQLQFSPSLNQSGSKGSELSQPTHGIHVNPKYLEARRQLEHLNADNNIQHGRRTSSISNTQGNSPFRFDGNDSGNAGGISSQVGAQIYSNDRGRSSAPEPERLFPSSSARLSSSSSPFGIGHAKPLAPPVDEFVMEEVSPRRAVEGASPSHPPFGYGIGSFPGRDDQSDQRRTRALIDAYGTDRRISETVKKPSQVKDLDITGIDSKVSAHTWRNSEEEEFEWEDMSPTLADRGHSMDSFSSSQPFPGSSRGRTGVGMLETNIRTSHWSNQDQESAYTKSNIPHEIAVPRDNEFRTESAEVPVSHHPPETWTQSQPWAPIPFPSTSTANEHRPPLIDRFPVAASQHHPSSNLRSNFPGLNVANTEFPTAIVPTSTGVWRPPINMPKSQPLPSVPSLPLQNQIRGHYDMMNARNAISNEGHNKMSVHQQQFDSIESKAPNQHHQFQNQQARPLPFNPQIPVSTTTYPPQYLLPHEVRQSSVPYSVASHPTHLVMRPMNRGYTPQRYDPPSTVLMNPVHGMQPPAPIFNVGNNSFHHSLPSAPPPLSQMTQFSQNPGPALPKPPPGGALSGLFGSLMAQGLISLTNQTPQDSVGLEFDADLLKVRHESAITALYADLPRQCRTCGLRFKSKEEHSSHMDWHLTKNRTSKNRKQKPSRKWFVSVAMWLSSAETLGTDVGPGFPLPTENVVEKKDEELAVPADEDQTVCELCGEPFDDFYSDETEEWMYRDAVYMNAPAEMTVGMDRSQLGPIIHAKCRSDSTVIASEDAGKKRKEYEDEGSQRKQMRS